MLSYQHAYHAGGPADIHKHALLAKLLATFTAKEKPLTYLETHAGRGLYDVGGAQSQRTGEAERGIARLRAAAPSWAEHFLRATGASPIYRGSPGIAGQLLRPNDRLILMELHPGEHAALRANLGSDPRIACHKRDGYEGLHALTPPVPRRGMVLIDPSYELSGSYDEVVAQVARVMRRWPQAVIAVWYPVKADCAGQIMRGQLISATQPTENWWHEVSFAAPELAPLARTRHLPRPNAAPDGRQMRGKTGMSGSGMVVLNPPWQWGEQVAGLANELTRFLQLSK